MFGANKKKMGFAGKRIYPIEKYLEIEKQVMETYEFWNEEVRKLNQNNDFYEGILKIKKLLSEKLVDGNQKVFSNVLLDNKKVWIEGENCLFYPDLLVVADVINFYQNQKDIISNPSIIIEASTAYSMGSINGERGDSTFLTDRTSKFWIYQKLPSLREYVLISDSGETVIETYNKLDDNCWKYQVFSNRRNNLVKFESVDITFPVRDIYL